MTPTTLREEISEILVRWNMPTRQAAINELVTLLEDREQRARLEERAHTLGELKMWSDIYPESTGKEALKGIATNDELIHLLSPTEVK